VYLTWKGVRRSLIVCLIVLSVYLAAWYFVAGIYGWEPFPRWSRIVARISDFKPTMDNLYDGIRFTIDRMGQGLKKIERVLREGKWFKW
jgi:hypothetical protein